MSIRSSTDCLIAFGANQGDCESRLQRAVEELSCHRFSIDKVSRPWKTKAVGGPLGQPDYLNAAIRARYSGTATQAVLDLLEIERSLGRVRTERWGPRTVDLDLLLFGRDVLATPEVVVPHPRLTFRRFVLEPSVEVAAEMVEPVTGKTIQELVTILDHREANLVWWTTAPERARCVIEELGLEEGIIATDIAGGAFEEGVRDWRITLVETVSEFRALADQARLAIVDQQPISMLRGLVQGPYVCMGGTIAGMTEELKATLAATL